VPDEPEEVVVVVELPWVIVKVPLLLLHPDPPARVQFPVIEPSLSGGTPFTSVPVTFPFNVSVLPEACTLYVNVPEVSPVLGLTEFNTMVPLSFWPSTGKQAVVLRNWKYVMVSPPAEPIENSVVKLKPDAAPSPPWTSALQIPLAADWACCVTVGLLQALNEKATNSKRATCFMNFS
jgi:hypothetical protein